jgi:hypothetical protein
VPGGGVGARLSVRRRPAIPALRAAAVAAALVVAAMVTWGLDKPPAQGLSASVTLDELRPAPQRKVRATVRLNAKAAQGEPDWLTVTAWQGGGLVVDRLERVGDGVYRTTEPIPVHGTWKALVRLHEGDSLTALPLYLPEDPAIPAPAVAAPAQFERSFVADHEILQREQKDAAGWLTVAAYAVVVAIALALLTLLAWGLHRLGTHTGEPSRSRSRSPSRAAVRVA